MRILYLGIIVALTLTACATSRGVIPPPAEPSSPAPPTPPAVTPAAPLTPINKTTSGPWSFSYTPGVYTYDIATQAQIAQRPDTALMHPVPPVSQRISIAVSDSGVQIVEPRLSDTPTVGCSPTAALTALAQTLLPSFPHHLSAGQHWTDSTTNEGCHGSVPMTSTLVRTYTVLGDTLYNGITAIHIKQTETIHAKGEGSQGQHRVLLEATGTGDADLYLDPTVGHLLSILSKQATNINISTSGRLSQFVQQVTEQVTLLPPAQ